LPASAALVIWSVFTAIWGAATVGRGVGAAATGVGAVVAGGGGGAVAVGGAAVARGQWRWNRLARAEDQRQQRENGNNVTNTQHEKVPFRSALTKPRHLARRSPQLHQTGQKALLVEQDRFPL
jgi:hypothetical protein